MSTEDALAAALRRVVARYGPHAPADPVALRTALAAVAPELPADELRLLVSVARAGLVDEVSPAGDRVAAAARLAAGGAVSAGEAARALAAFDAVLGRAASDSPGAGPTRITWDDTRPPTRSRIGLLVGSVAVAVLVVAGAVAALLLPGAPAPAAPDRFAIEQVALRYRALGADLLAGALRCAPLPAAAGKQEQVRCDFGDWRLDLVAYDTADALRAARAAAVTPAPDSARSARADAPGSAFLMDQTTTGAARVYWDAEAPRPVSATAAGALPLAELLGIFDERRFGGVQRPEPPGAAFTSPALWGLAEPVVVRGGGTCRARARADFLDGVVDQVDCDFPGGLRGTFGAYVDEAEMSRSREGELDPSGTVPGTQRSGSWGEDRLVVEYVLPRRDRPTPYERSYLYYDRRDLLAFGMLWTEGVDQTGLRRFWQAHTG